MARRSGSRWKISARRPTGYRRPLAVEQLEPRTLLAITVNSLVDEADGSITDGDISLRDAIASAAPGEMINFAAALTASGPAKILLTRGELLINKALSIVGPGANLLTIDAKGNDTTPNFFTGNGSRVFRVDDGLGPLVDVAIENLTLTGADHAGFGGAIRSHERLTLRHTVFFHNGAADGGAIGTGGPLSVYDSEFYDNHATSGGGAINVLLSSATAQIVRSTLRDNTAQVGGAVYWFGGLSHMLTLDKSLVKNNTSETSGGGIHAAGPVTVTDSSVVGNTSKRDGAGLFSVKPLIVSRSLIASNRIVNANLGVGDGGGIYVGSNARISDSTISANAAARRGGGLYVTNADPATPNPDVVVSNSTMLENHASVTGGGIHTYWPMQIRHSTIARNTANSADWPGDLTSGGAGGGIFFYAQNAGLDVTLVHSIVAENSSLGAASDLGSYRLQSLAYSFFIFDGSLVKETTGYDEAFTVAWPSLRGVDPKLSPQAIEYGDQLPGGYRLKSFGLAPDSPAINAGDTSAMAGAGGVPQFDQRGTPWSRVVGGRIDIGAVEAQANPLPGDYNFDGVVDAADYSVWRDTLSSTIDLRADGSGLTAGVPDGVVNLFDFAFWKLNFGNVLGGGGAASLAVNEPLAVLVDESAAPAISGSAAMAGELRLAGSTVTLATLPARGSSPAVGSKSAAAASDADGSLLAWLLQARTRSDSPAPSEESDPTSACDLGDNREVDAIDSAFASIGFSAGRRGL